MTNQAENSAELPPPTSFRGRFGLGVASSVVGIVAGWILVTGLIMILAMNRLLPPFYGEGYGPLGILICFNPFLPPAFGLLAAWLGPVASRSHPDRLRRTVALIGFSLGVASWVFIAVLAAAV